MATETSSASAEQQPDVINLELNNMLETPSLCLRCNAQGTTRMLVTKIPHFREIIVSSFSCDSCGEENKLVQFGGSFGEMHVFYELKVESPEDLNRQVVKSEYALLRIPELDFEIVPNTQPGMLTTVEGIIRNAMESLSALQPQRREQDPNAAQKIDDFIARLALLLTGKEKFTVHLDDPSGNSYIESILNKEGKDLLLYKEERPRTEIDRQRIGLSLPYNEPRNPDEQQNVDFGRVDVVTTIPTECAACRQPGEVRVHPCHIPKFRDTVIMALKCDACGYKNHEITGGGSVSEKGQRITLRVENPQDLNRDVLKSNSSSLKIPEIDLELSPGTLGSFFTTVEGILDKVKEKLASLPQMAFEGGDSARLVHLEREDGRPSGGSTNERRSMMDVVKSLEELMKVQKPFTLILDDPLAASYIQSFDEDEKGKEYQDPQVTVEEYTRTYEQDEELGLHDMKTDE